MKVLKIFTKECSNDDLGLTLSFYGHFTIALRAFIWEEFVDFLGEFVPKKIINTVK